MIECSLTEIKDFLESQQISCKLVQSKAHPHKTLLVEMGEETIRINLIERALPAPIEEEPKQAKETANFLYFQYFFPFGFEEKAVADLARYLLMLNRSLEFPGFGTSESDRRIYFRQELYCGFSKIQRRMILSVLGYILLMVDSFRKPIYQISKQKKSLKEIISESL